MSAPLQLMHAGAPLRWQVRKYGLVTSWQKSVARKNSYTSGIYHLWAVSGKLLKLLNACPRRVLLMLRMPGHHSLFSLRLLPADCRLPPTTCCIFLLLLLLLFLLSCSAPRHCHCRSVLYGAACRAGGALRQVAQLRRAQFDPAISDAEATKLSRNLHACAPLRIVSRVRRLAPL